MASLAFPESEPNDPATVTSALQIGKRDWDRAEFADAVRWIRKAADAAEASGNDARSLQLARVAADLKSSLEGSFPPPVPRDEGAALAPFDDFNDQTIVDAPAVMVARQTAQSVVNIEDTRESAVAPASRPSATEGVRSRTTLRVAVALTSSRAGTLNVAILPDGSAPPVGTTEALLVLLDPEVRLTGGF